MYVDRIAIPQPFLVLYEYGQGGVWAFLSARSRSEIERKFPQLQVFDDPPDWMSGSDLARIREQMSFDIDDQDSGFLASIVGSRGDAGGTAATPR